MFVNRYGLGDDTTGTGIDVGTLLGQAGQFAIAPVSVGGGAGVPVWAVAAGFFTLFWLVTTIGGATKRTGQRISKRAGKIRRGFTS